MNHILIHLILLFLFTVHIKGSLNFSHKGCPKRATPGYNSKDGSTRNCTFVKTIPPKIHINTKIRNLKSIKEKASPNTPSKNKGNCQPGYVYKCRVFGMTVGKDLNYRCRCIKDFEKEEKTRSNKLNPKITRYQTYHPIKNSQPKCKKGYYYYCRPGMYIGKGPHGDCYCRKIDENMKKY